MRLMSHVIAMCVAAGAALADETRISIGYGTVDQEYDHPEVDTEIILGGADTNGKGYYLLAEGDEADFLWNLSFSRHSVAGTGPFMVVNPALTPELTNITGLDYTLDVETVGATLGWHGLRLGEFGFGPAITYARTRMDGSIISNRGQDFGSFSRGAERGVAGVLMRKESDLIDLSATAGSIVQGDAWEHGLVLSIDAEVHVSEAVTLTGDWNRAWGDLAGVGNASADMFGFGGRVRVSNGFFLEGVVSRRKNGTSVIFGDDVWGTAVNIGVGVAF